jgi:hypothetical protein
MAERAVKIIHASTVPVYLVLLMFEVLVVAYVANDAGFLGLRRCNACVLAELSCK